MPEMISARPETPSAPTAETQAGMGSATNQDATR